MPAQLAELSRAFDELRIARQPTFAQLVREGRLRYGSALGHCDVIDDYSSRLVCECISRQSSLLMIWPDSQERRAPLALAAGIVCDSVPRLGAPSISVAVDDWCRQVKAFYALSPLSCAGSLVSSGRFNYGNDLDVRFPRFPALYIAENRATAHCEMFQIAAELPGKLSIESMNFQPSQSIAAYALGGTVHQVFDLTRPENLAPFMEVTKDFALSTEMRQMEKALRIPPRQVAQTPEQLMTTIRDQNWRAYPMYADVPANSQVLGSLLQDAGFEAVLYDSVRLAGGRAMAIFPRALQNSSSVVRVVGAPAEARHTLLNAATCREIGNAL